MGHGAAAPSRACARRHERRHGQHGRRHWRARVAALVATAALAGGALGQATSVGRVYEGPSGNAAAVQTARGTAYMAVTANPHASRAAAAVLKRGGGAADAAIAAQLMLGLVEPQSSGLGGGAFVLYWDQANNRLHAYDGRETAPAAVTSRHFSVADGSEMPFWDAVIGGHAVGVPGVPALLGLLHRRHGRLRWATLHWPAVRLAEQGFAVSGRLHAMLSYMPRIDAHPGLGDYLLRKDGKPLPVGYVRRNPRYAKTLRTLALGGAEAFYRGPLAQAIVDAVQNDPIRPGPLSIADMHAYQAVERKPLCGRYAQRRICGMPPPSSGGSTTLAILGMLAKLETGEPHSAQRLHQFAEASKLAFADRNVALADPDFAPQPLRALLDPSYLAQRAQRIRAGQAMPKAAPGIPAPRPSGRSPELPSTSHMSIVDRHGNVLSMTTSIEVGFGSRAMVGGFLLNNQLTDFSFAPADQPQPANAPAPGKRPRSSMSPTIVFGAEGTPELAIGSPGGSRIIAYVAQALRHYLVDDMSVDEILAAGHVAHVNDGTLELERGRFSRALIQRLESFGHHVEEQNLTSGLHAVQLRDGIISGYADPRREGLPIGE